MSRLFQQVMHELGVGQYKFTSYHPESQGTLERFHQTLKTTMRTIAISMRKNGMRVFI
jgi:hypothetical protein